MIVPATLAPPAPFPLIVAQTSLAEFVAPGIRRADYRLMTSDGPLVVHVVAIDPSEPTVRLGVVVARDRMISSGETISSMARRTGAVAGVNADYFDITNTNQPLNVVVRDGTVLRTPSKRVAMTVGRDRSVAIGPVRFAGSYADGTTRMPLTTVNEWPPQGGVGLLTPAYGMLTAQPNVQLAQLAPVDTVAGTPGTYRVLAVGPPVAGPVLGVALGFGPAALAMGAPPSAGDLVQLAFDTQPPAATLVAAVGGGPQLVAGGAPFDDPNSPAPEERNVHFPVSGALREADGSLLLVAVDGRRPATSIGLTRPQFGALMRAFGAIDAMAFDSGGSATLVARVLGDAQPSVVNDPSDGVERPVADGLFAYSDAPVGIDPHLVVRPATFGAFAGATIALGGAIVDAAGHRVRAATVLPFTADPAPGAHLAVVRDTLGATARIAYTSVDRVATLAIAGDRAQPQPGDQLTLVARATDVRGEPVLLGDAPVRWTLDASAFVGPRFAYDTRRGDGIVTATLGGASARLAVRVGTHEEPVPFAPATLAYDLTGTARSAAAPQALALPDEPSRFALDVFGDASGVPLRAAFVNRYGERTALTLAPHVDWTGWRRVSIALPPELTPPVTLTSLYVVPSLGGPPVRTAGTLRFRAPSVVVPGMR